MPEDDTVWGGVPIFENNNSSNLTNEEFLARVLGPKNVGYTLLALITITYLIIFTTGVIGNVAVCLVIARNKSMHTSTNYYLFSLAISDLMILILGLPNDLTIYWQQYPWIFGELLCKGRSLVSEMTSYSSVLTIVAFSTERYLAICHPIYSHTMSGFHRAVRIIGCIWVVSFISAIPYALFTKLNYIDRPFNSGNFLEESAFCALLDNNIYPKNYPLHEVSSFVFFIFPMIILILLYIRMGLRIRETSVIQRNLPKISKQTNSVLISKAENRICIAKLIQKIKYKKTELQTSSNIQRTPRGDNNNGDITILPNDHLYFINHEAVVIQRQHSDDTDSFTPRVRSDKRSVLILLGAVVITFFLCWAPFHAQRLSFVYFKESPLFRTLNEYLYYISGFMYYLSATVNPILYNLMSLKYRHAFKQMLFKKRRSSTNGGLNKGVLISQSKYRAYTFKSEMVDRRNAIPGVARAMLPRDAEDGKKRRTTLKLGEQSLSISSSSSQNSKNEFYKKRETYSY